MEVIAASNCDDIIEAVIVCAHYSGKAAYILEKCHKSAQMCGQHAYQAPAPRPVWALDNESKARPAAQTRSRDNKNKDSQLPRVERKKKPKQLKRFLLPLLHLANVPSLRACIHACACLGYTFSTTEVALKGRTSPNETVAATHRTASLCTFV